MAICSILEKKIPGRDCSFNAPLKEYLSEVQNDDEVLVEGLKASLDDEPDVWIICDLEVRISRSAISNRIIYYRDIFKLKGAGLRVPYMVYRHTEEKDYALLIVRDKPAGYLYARGYYYCMSEPSGEYYDCRNDIVEISPETSEEIVSIWQKMKTEKSGVIQRQIDRRYFATYDALMEEALKAAAALKLLAEEDLPRIRERSETIGYFVSRWFLLKKVVYVQYMVNRKILSEIHENDIKKQRNQAKLNADAVEFISYRNLWTLE